MPINDITLCNNTRCILDNICRRARPQWPKDLQHISIACFGPDNGDMVEVKMDCDMYLTYNNNEV